MDEKRMYIAIDLKSFFASVECRERGLDPMSTNLLVADTGRTEKTICLAVTPSLKAYGISGRARLFEAIEKVRQANERRRLISPDKKLIGESFDDKELKENPSLAIGFITAEPRMAHYLEYSTRIYNVYLRYVSPEDIHVYSIDEVFIDVTKYLLVYKCTAHELAVKIIRDVLSETGITSTAGIGTNLYLCKVAMDIVAKKMPADKDGVRIAELDELSYRKTLWKHRPLTDFWRVGKGISAKLEANGMFTMGDVARCSLEDEDLLYRLFGINAELLIDHAWGYESCLMEDIKAYKPQSSSISSGQVLHTPYKYEKARIIVREMVDLLVLELVEKKLLTDQITLDIGYDIENLTNPAIRKIYKGEIKKDFYGRRVPKPAHGSINTEKKTSSTKIITDCALNLFEKIADKNLLIRKITVTFSRVFREDEVFEEKNHAEQMDFFVDYKALDREKAKEDIFLQKERKRQEAIIEIRKKYGKNAMLKGTDYEEGATTRERNRQIGGHKA